MGVYYQALNETKNETFCSHAFGEGLKFREWIYWEVGYEPSISLFVLGWLLVEGGRWSGDRIAIVPDTGDRADDALDISHEIILTLCDEDRLFREYCESHHPLGNKSVTILEQAANGG